MSKFAWVTLSTNDTYALGSLVLAYSLRRVKTSYPMIVLITTDVTSIMRNKLAIIYDLVKDVNILDSQDSAHLAYLARPELGITFTKLHCWNLIGYDKCVFLDADTLVLRNCDELFERDELSAAPDVSWPDCFNSGVFVYRPNTETFDKIMKFASDYGSFDGGDQGLLNKYFSKWPHSDINKHLPFIYNVTAYASYCYLPAFKHFRDNIKILHFAGRLKPWLLTCNPQNHQPNIPKDYIHAMDFIKLWWDIYYQHVQQHLDNSMPYRKECKQHQQQPHNQLINAIPIQHKNNSNVKNKIKKQYIMNNNFLQYFIESLKTNTQTIMKSNSNNSTEQHIIQKQQQQQKHKHNNCNILHTTISTSTCNTNSFCPIPISVTMEQSNTFSNKAVKKQNVLYKSTNKIQEETLHINNKNIKANLYTETKTKEKDKKTDLDVQAGLAGLLSRLYLNDECSDEIKIYEEITHRQYWELGDIDYTGRDAFENIWKHIQQTLDNKSVTSSITE